MYCFQLLSPCGCALITLGMTNQTAILYSTYGRRLDLASALLYTLRAALPPADRLHRYCAIFGRNLGWCGLRLGKR